MNATQPTSSTPTINSVVATGRRINMREGFMGPSYRELNCCLLLVLMDDANAVPPILVCSILPAQLMDAAPLPSLAPSCFCLADRRAAKCASLFAACPARQ